MRSSSGEFTINGFSAKDEPIDLRMSLGMLSHSPFLYDELLAYENLEFFGRVFKVKRNDLKSRIKNLLRKVGLQHRMYDRVETFSRGMKQRLSIARAIIHEPKVLLLDEPYTGLDQNASKLFDNILMDFKEKGGTIIMATHNFERGLKLSDRVVILTKGKIMFDSSSKDIDIKKLKRVYQKLVS
jgi:ABC-type multidrug transport system ATPase subunit